MRSASRAKLATADGSMMISPGALDGCSCTRDTPSRTCSCKERLTSKEPGTIGLRGHACELRSLRPSSVCDSFEIDSTHPTGFFVLHAARVRHRDFAAPRDARHRSEASHPCAESSASISSKSYTPSSMCQVPSRSRRMSFASVANLSKLMNTASCPGT